MPMVKDSSHFLAQDHIPRIESSVPFGRVYEELGARGVSGFILVEAGRPKGYVRASQLAVVAVNKVSKDSGVMEQLTHTSIGRVVSEHVNESPQVLVHLHPSRVDARNEERDLQTQVEKVFEVDEFGTQLGWYLNQENIRDTLTEKTFFLCANGHRNVDPDHGTCYSCPFPIIGTEVG